MSAGTIITDGLSFEEKKTEVNNLAGLSRTEAVRNLIFLNFKKCNKEGEKNWYLLLPVWKDVRFYQWWALECKI